MSAGKTYLFLRGSKISFPEISSFMTGWGFGCPVCMIKPLVYVTERSEYCVAYRGSGLLQKVWACRNTSKRERLG